MMWAARFQSLEAVSGRLRRYPLDHWLADGERDRLASIRSTQRAVQWLCGRWLAKELLLEQPHLEGFSPLDLRIESRDAHQRSSRPCVFLRGGLQPWRMSISHSSRSVYAAVAVAPETSIGVDVTVKQLMPPGFSRFWLAPAEREWSHREGSQAVSLLWSLKESWYKAGGGEHPFTPKRLDVVTALSLNDLSLGELACNVPRPVPGDMLGGALLCHISSEEVASLVLLHDRTSLRPETFTFKEISP